MGVWARDLTREGIFEALWNRRVFATTNARMFLEFSVSFAPMGSILKTGLDRPIHARAVNAAPIGSIEIVRNGEVWQSAQFDRQDAVLDVVDPDKNTSAWYYARVTCLDGNMAWSSPVWIEG